MSAILFVLGFILGLITTVLDRKYVAFIKKSTPTTPEELMKNIRKFK